MYDWGSMLHFMNTWSSQTILLYTIFTKVVIYLLYVVIAGSDTTGGRARFPGVFPFCGPAFSPGVRISGAPLPRRVREDLQTP